MAFRNGLFGNLGLGKTARASRARFGKAVRFEGVPAILVGVAFILGASQLTAIAEKAGPLIPEILREARALWQAVRGERRKLAP